MSINRIFLGIGLLYNVFVFAVRQRESVICMHTAPPSFPHPIPPGHHRAPSWTPCATQQFPTSYAFYTWESIYSCLGNPMDGGAWWAAVHGVAKSRVGHDWHDVAAAEYLYQCYMLLHHTARVIQPSDITRHICIYWYILFMWPPW